MGMRDHAREVRNALSDPVKLCTGLGLDKGSQRQSGGLLVCCPVHGDRRPSCSVTLGPDGTVRVKCFACDYRGDALRLISTVLGLDDFREILAEGARLAGAYSLEAEIRDGKARPERERIQAPPPGPTVDYPDPREVMAFWRQCTAVADDVQAAAYLAKRAIEATEVDTMALARIISEPLPEWARYGQRTWIQTSHRMVVRMFGADGDLRSVRAIRVGDYESPKRLPPKGHRAAELVMLNAAGWKLLARGMGAETVVLVEGEPDFLTIATAMPTVPVLGLVSGSWTQNFADAMPARCTALVMTHADDAGDRYAREIIRSLEHKCDIRRLDLEAA